MPKKINNPKKNSSEFAYVRVALGLALEISSNAIAALVFSISRYICIEHNICYSIILFYFALNLSIKLLFFVILILSLIIIYQKYLYYIF